MKKISMYIRNRIKLLAQWDKIGQTIKSYLNENTFNSITKLVKFKGNILNRKCGILRRNNEQHYVVPNGR